MAQPHNHALQYSIPLPRDPTAFLQHIAVYLRLSFLVMGAAGHRAGDEGESFCQVACDLDVDTGGFVFAGVQFWHGAP